MAIIKKPVAPSMQTVDDFIQAAPDAASQKDGKAMSKGFPQGKQAQISLAMPGELLEKIDQAAQSLSISRAGFIKMTLSKALGD